MPWNGKLGRSAAISFLGALLICPHLLAATFIDPCGLKIAIHASPNRSLPKIRSETAAVDVAGRFDPTLPPQVLLNWLTAFTANVAGAAASVPFENEITATIEGVVVATLFAASDPKSQRAVEVFGAETQLVYAGTPGRQLWRSRGNGGNLIPVGIPAWIDQRVKHEALKAELLRRFQAKYGVAKLPATELGQLILGIQIQETAELLVATSVRLVYQIEIDQAGNVQIIHLAPDPRSSQSVGITTYTCAATDENAAKKSLDAYAVRLAEFMRVLIPKPAINPIPIPIPIALPASALSPPPPAKVTFAINEGLPVKQSELPTLPLWALPSPSAPLVTVSPTPAATHALDAQYLAEFSELLEHLELDFLSVIEGTETLTWAQEIRDWAQRIGHPRQATNFQLRQIRTALKIVQNYSQWFPATLRDLVVTDSALAAKVGGVFRRPLARLVNQLIGDGHIVEETYGIDPRVLNVQIEVKIMGRRKLD